MRVAEINLLIFNDVTKRSKKQFVLRKRLFLCCSQCDRLTTDDDHVVGFAILQAANLNIGCGAFAIDDRIALLEAVIVAEIDGIVVDRVIDLDGLECCRARYLRPAQAKLGGIGAGVGVSTSGDVVHRAAFVKTSAIDSC